MMTRMNKYMSREIVRSHCRTYGVNMMVQINRREISEGYKAKIKYVQI